MGPAEEQLRLGKLTAENLRDVVLKLIEMDKAASVMAGGGAIVDQTRDPRLRGKTAAAAHAAPHVVDYAHGRRSPGDNPSKLHFVFGTYLFSWHASYFEEGILISSCRCDLRLGHARIPVGVSFRPSTRGSYFLGPAG